MSAVLETREPSARYLEAVQPLLVRQFELLATAPGGVARLRELILALAVQGKVVQQDPGDEPASELLRRIRLERTELVAAGSIKQGKPSAPVSPEEEPCPLPRGWAWVRFGDLIHELCTGPFGSLIHKEDYVSGGVPLINPSHMIDGRIEHDPAVSVSASMASQLSAYRLSSGDVLLARRGEMGRYALVTEREAGWLCGTGSFFLKLSEAYDRRFFGLTLEDPRLRRHLLGESVGATMTNLNQRILLDVVVAVAPLAEQSRIVARVDELMRLCDALEAKGRLEAEQHARLLGTLLGTLTDSSTPEELAANWQRVADHFDLLLDRPEAVDALEQTILQLAVRGVLVPQDPSDESASELIRLMRSHRDEQVRSGLAKRERPFTPLSEADLPFELPTGWEWIRFDDLIEPAKPISYGVLVPGPDIDRGVPFVRIADLSLTDPPAKPEKSISTEVDAKYQRTRLEGGEILMGVVGSIGKLGVAPPTWAGANIARAICRIVPVSLVNKDFVLLLLQSEFMRASFAVDTRTLAQPTLNVGLIRGSATPLPPIAEQARIAARVTELRRLCSDLRQRLTRSRGTQAALAEALINDALVA